MRENFFSLYPFFTHKTPFVGSRLCADFLCLQLCLLWNVCLYPEQYNLTLDRSLLLLLYDIFLALFLFAQQANFRLSAGIALVVAESFPFVPHPTLCFEMRHLA